MFYFATSHSNAAATTCDVDEPVGLESNCPPSQRRTQATRRPALHLANHFAHRRQDPEHKAPLALGRQHCRENIHCGSLLLFALLLRTQAIEQRGLNAVVSVARYANPPGTAHE